jgi:hypothetical protein
MSFTSDFVPSAFLPSVAALLSLPSSSSFPPVHSVETSFTSCFTELAIDFFRNFAITARDIAATANKSPNGINEADVEEALRACGFSIEELREFRSFLDQNKQEKFSEQIKEFPSLPMSSNDHKLNIINSQRTHSLTSASSQPSSSVPSWFPPLPPSFLYSPPFSSSSSLSSSLTSSDSRKRKLSQTHSIQDSLIEFSKIEESQKNSNESEKPKTWGE